MTAQNTFFPPLPAENQRTQNNQPTSALPTNPTPDEMNPLAAAVIQQAAPLTPPQQPVGSAHKEAAPITQEVKPQQQESAPLVEVSEQEPLPAEVEGWLQKLDQEGDIKLEKPITHDGEVLLADSDAQVVKEVIVLPLSQSSSKKYLKSQITDSARWLAEWCLRLLKSMKDRVKYAPETINQSPETTKKT